MRRRWKRIAIGGVLLLLIAAGLYLFVFFGERRPLAGTPYALVIQPGVADQSVALATQGLAIADAYLQKQGVETVNKPIDVKLARWSPCSPWRPILAEAPTAIADDQQICVNTISAVWRQGLRETPGIALSVMAHEHYHVVQGQHGCLPGPDDHTYAWIVEGSATYIGWETAIDAGLLERDWVDDLMAGIIADAPPVSLAAHEADASGDAVYMRGAQAIAELVRRGGSLKSLERFCAEVGGGADWRAAFESAFGIGVDAFYAEFAATHP